MEHYEYAFKQGKAMRIHPPFHLCLTLFASMVTAFHVTSPSSVSSPSRSPASTSTSALAASRTTELHVVPSIKHIVDDYDVFLLDMWGVMHDGTRAYDGVLDVVKKLKIAKKTLIILSNSSKRRDNSVKMLTKLGFDPSDFDEIITSGEVAYQLLRYLSETTELQDSSLSWVPPMLPQPLLDLKKSLSSRKVLCFGSGYEDKEYIESCGWGLADSIAEADLIVARGSFVVQDAQYVVDKIVDGEVAYFEAYHNVLNVAAQKKVPMVVCNPDKIRPDADKSPMPGTIGIAYQSILAKAYNGNTADDLVLYIGKPFSDVYDIALRDYKGKRACMLGDALETDVTGADASSIDSIWIVNNGVHNEDVAAKAGSVIGELNDEQLQAGCRDVLQAFNQQAEESYAKGRQVAPTVLLRFFQW